jgi:preprotein translocase subunit YajC
MPNLKWSSVLIGVVLAVVFMWFMNSRRKTKAT